MRIMDETRRMGMSKSAEQKADAILKFEQYLALREQPVGNE
jgi:hypothetical protein